jgi:pimeloyl-ACP methyl ester carboxylesterase
MADKKKIILGDTDMDYVVFGKGEKTLVILPGLSDGMTTVKGKGFLLSNYYKMFAKHFKVYVFSRKNAISQGYFTKDMAADQKSAMDQLGIKKAMVFGVSQGGMIAQWLAIDHPECVSKLILGVTIAKPNDTLKTVVDAWIKMAQSGDYGAFVEDSIEKTYTKKS